MRPRERGASCGRRRIRAAVPSRATHGNANLHWAARGRIVFLAYVDGWPHLYSMAETGGEPLLLTPGNYMAEYITPSPDGAHLVFAGNAGSTPDDLHRRHIVKVPVLHPRAPGCGDSTRSV